MNHRLVWVRIGVMFCLAGGLAVANPRASMAQENTSRVVMYGYSLYGVTPLERSVPEGNEIVVEWRWCARSRGQIEQYIRHVDHVLTLDVDGQVVDVPFTVQRTRIIPEPGAEGEPGECQHAALYRAWLNLDPGTYDLWLDVTVVLPIWDGYMHFNRGHYWPLELQAVRTLVVGGEANEADDENELAEWLATPCE